MWTLLGLLGLVASLIVLIYIPPVQDFVIPRVLSAISEPGQLEISARKVRLKFPLRVEIDSASFAVPGMEAGARAGRLNVSPLPLLRGEISVSDLKLDGARFRLGTPDSAFYMTALVNDASMSDARIRLSSQRIMVGELMVDSGKVDMAILPDTVPRPEAADSVPANWHVTLVHGGLRRIRYNMSIYPTITELGCHLQQGDIRMADVDMRHNTVDVQEVSMSRADARYIYPTPEWLAAHPAPEIAETDTVATVPWTVRCAKVRLADSEGLYAMAGHKPLSQNFDLEYIRASQINIAIDSFVNRGTSVYAPIRSITARERCGIPVALIGLFDMDSVSMRATGMRLATASSDIALDAMMGLTPPPPHGEKAPEGLDPSTPFRIDLRAQISNDDLRRLAPAPMAPITDALPRGVPVNAAVDADGTMGNIRARLIKVEIPRHLTLMASGVLRDITDINHASGHLTLDGSMPDISFIKPTLLDAKTAGQINFPRMTISGEADINHGDYAATFRGTADDGTIALDGTWKGRGPAYELTFTADRFPVQSIMPSLGISNVSADVDVRGHGLDIFSPSTAINAGIDLRHLGYKGQSYENINARANIAAGRAAVRAISTNRDADFDISATGNLTGDTLRWRLKGNLNHIDLMALQLSDTIGRGSATLSGEAAFTLPKTHISGRGRHRRVTRDPLTLHASLDVERLNWQMPNATINTTDILANVDIDTTSCALTLNNGDLSAKASAGVGLDTLMTRFGAVQALLQRCMARRQLAVDSLQMALPDFRIALNSGDNNVLTELLHGSDLAFDTLALHASNDSLLRADATLTGLQAGKTRADSIALRIRQRGDHLLYQLKMDNRPGTMDQFAHVVAQGYISIDNFLLIFNQRNISDETGFSFGSVVTMPQENTFSLKFVPFHPIIGYKNWQINPDNFLRYNVKTGHIDANINLHNDVSSLLLTTDHVQADSTQEALRLQLKDIKVQDWLAINPFAPPMRGNVSADMSFNLGENFSSIDGKGNVSLTDFYYNNQRVADFNAELGLTTSPGGVVRASSALIVDGVKTITVTGALNDSTLADPFNLDFEMIRFPLAVLNPFMPKGTARFHGLLTGSMDVTGNADKPLFNGWIRFDSTAVNVEMMGSTLDFPTTQIPVKDNLVTFDNFAIHAVNDNPLVISGTADISSLADIGLDITARARNTQIVGAKKKTRSGHVWPSFHRSRRPGARLHGPIPRHQRLARRAGRHQRYLCGARHAGRSHAAQQPADGAVCQFHRLGGGGRSRLARAAGYGHEHRFHTQRVRRLHAGRRPLGRREKPRPDSGGRPTAIQLGLSRRPASDRPHGPQQRIRALRHAAGDVGEDFQHRGGKQHSVQRSGDEPHPESPRHRQHQGFGKFAEQPACGHFRCRPQRHRHPRADECGFRPQLARRPRNTERDRIHESRPARQPGHEPTTLRFLHRSRHKGLDYGQPALQLPRRATQLAGLLGNQGCRHLVRHRSARPQPQRGELHRHAV